MKKEWKQPTLEVLEVKMTMANTEGTHYDGNYSEHHLIVPDAYFPS